MLSGSLPLLFWFSINTACSLPFLPFFSAVKTYPLPAFPILVADPGLSKEGRRCSIGSHSISRLDEKAHRKQTRELVATVRLCPSRMTGLWFWSVCSVQGLMHMLMHRLCRRGKGRGPHG